MAIDMEGQTMEVSLASSRSHALGPVANDWEAAAVWLEHLRLRPLAPTTIQSYRNELAKVRWYCETLAHPTPRLWSVKDAIAFISWLQDSAHGYVSPRSLPTDAPEWTPFKSVPSKASIATTLKVLNALFKFWVASGYIERSPMLGLGRESSRAQKRVVRSVAPQFMEAVFRHLEVSAGTQPRQFLRMVRNRFILVLLERTGLRANEAVQANMDDIEPVTDPRDQQTYWRLNVRFAKGGKESSVLLDSVVLDALRDYRTAFGFPSMPTGDERDTALILSVHTDSLRRRHDTTIRFSAPMMRRSRAWRPIRRRQTLWSIVKTEFKETAAALRQQGYAEQADHLEKASTHWLRHTFGTRLVQEGHDLRLVAQMMRHASIHNTMIYTEQEFLDVARAMQKHSAEVG